MWPRLWKNLIFRARGGIRERALWRLIYLRAESNGKAVVQGDTETDKRIFDGAASATE